MLKLMKYELRKTLSTKLVLLGVTAAAEAAYLISLCWLRDSFVLPLSILLLVLLATGGVMGIGLESVVTLHRDMNTKQSYMLFMTPNSSYAILGAKMLEMTLSVLLSGAFFFALGTLDITLLFAREDMLNQLWSTLQDVVHALDSQLTLNAVSFASFLFSLLAGWICVIATAYLADVISAALLNGKKHNGVVSFVVFLLLSILTEWLMQAVTRTLTPYNVRLVTQGCIALALAAVMYVVTAQIMERKLSV